MGAAEGILARHPKLFKEQVPSVPQTAEGLQQGTFSLHESPVETHVVAEPSREFSMSSAQMNLKSSVTAQIAPATQVSPASHPPPIQIAVLEDT